MRKRLLATLDRRFFRFMSVMAALNYINEILTKGWFLSLASGMLLLVLCKPPANHLLPLRPTLLVAASSAAAAR